MRLAERAFGKFLCEPLITQKVMSQSESAVSQMHGAEVVRGDGRIRVSARGVQRCCIIRATASCRPQPP